MLGRVGDQLGDAEVGDRLQGRDQAAVRLDARVHVHGDRQGRPRGERLEGDREAAVERRRVDAPGQLAQLRERLLGRRVGGVDQLGGLGDVAALGQVLTGLPELHGDGHEACLRAVVQVALDAAQAGVGVLHGAGAGPLQLGDAQARPGRAQQAGGQHPEQQREHPRDPRPAEEQHQSHQRGDEDARRCVDEVVDAERGAPVERALAVGLRGQVPVPDAVGQRAQAGEQDGHARHERDDRQRERDQHEQQRAPPGGVADQGADRAPEAAGPHVRRGHGDVEVEQLAGQPAVHGAPAATAEHHGAGDEEADHGHGDARGEAHGEDGVGQGERGQQEHEREVALLPPGAAGERCGQEVGTWPGGAALDGAGREPVDGHGCHGARFAPAGAPATWGRPPDLAGVVPRTRRGGPQRGHLP